MYRTAPLALLSLLGAALVPATALAAGLAFTWDAPPECPTAEAVERRLTQLLADAGRPSPPEGAVRVVVTPGQTRHSARISLQLGADPPSVRLLSAPSCAELADAATLAVALALTAPEAPRPAPEPATRPPPIAPDRPAERPLPAPTAPPPIARLHLSLRGAAGLDAATLPAASPGGSLGLALSLGPAEVELSALGLFAQTAERASPPGTGAEVSLFAGRARGCLSPEIVPLHLRPCLGLELGSLQAEGLGVPAPTSGSGRWLTPELALGVGGRLFPPLSLGLEVSALFPLARDHFVLEGIGDVYRAPAFSARAAFTVEARVF